MSLKTWIAPHIAGYLTSEARLNRRRDRSEKRRRATRGMHDVHYFHDVGDPYSHLVAQALPDLVARYDIRLTPHLTGPPPDWAAPERDRLDAYSRLDAARLAGRSGYAFADPGRQPAAEALSGAADALAAAIEAGTFVQRAASIGAALWSGAPVTELARAGGGAAAMKAGSALRETLGHYLGATFHFAGEWYWGLDRLHYLEARLAGLGAGKTGRAEAPIFAPPGLGAASDRAAPASARELHFYLSFRSPYTYISAVRAKALADAYGADLKLRFVLPMVMRGLPVPRMKGQYIVQDVAREARRLGIPFGRINDPVGRPVERGYSLLPWARDQGRGGEYCLSFLTAVWSQGVDAGSDSGLRRIVEAAGLSWADARRIVDNDDWRGEAEANRAEMMALGLWGVPSFRVGENFAWGQDRLWVAEDALRDQ